MGKQELLSTAARSAGVFPEGHDPTILMPALGLEELSSKSSLITSMLNRLEQAAILQAQF